MFIIITLSEFLIEYADVNTMVSVRTYDTTREEDITYPSLTVSEWLKNMEKYKEIMDKEIAIVSVENNVMVIYLWKLVN